MARSLKKGPYIDFRLRKKSIMLTKVVIKVLLKLGLEDQ